MKRKQKPQQPRILTAEVNYTQRVLKGFNNRGLAIYYEVSRVQIIYACTHDELKRNVKSFQASVNGISTYQYHRKPRTYIEVISL